MAMRGKHAAATARTTRHPWSVVYLVLVMVLLAIPAVTTPFAPHDADAELQELAAPPELINTDGHPNVGVLADAGEWFDDHFGFRQALITANARVMADVLFTSPTEQVIIGTDGYLYYGGTLADYAKSHVLSAQAADNAAFNLALMERAVRARGAEFVLTVAPNKNTLYPEYMPGFDLAGVSPSSWDVLREALERHGVTYVDLFTLLGSQEGVLYMKTDTHWTTRGALLAYNALMDALGRPHFTYEASPTRWDETFVGDLEAMLYPLGRTPEPVEVVEEAERFAYVNGATSVEDSAIETASAAEGSTGSLVMYRDSFGNALLPLFATQYARGYFTELVPYYLQSVDEYGADAVIVERAERHLDFFATTPPLMAAPRVGGWALSELDPETTGATLEWSLNGPFVQIEGLIDPALRSADDRIFVVVTDASGQQTWYEAFHKTFESTAAATTFDSNPAPSSPDDSLGDRTGDSLGDGPSDPAAAEGAATLSEVDRATAAAEHPATNDCGYFISIPADRLPVGAQITIALGHDNTAIPLTLSEVPAL